MPNSETDHKPKDDAGDRKEENHKNRKPPAEQSVNTRILMNKMSVKKPAPDQRKITFYKNFSNSTTASTISLQQGANQNGAINLQQQKIKELEEGIKQKDLEIEKMKKNKEIDQSRYNKLFIENKEYVKKTREVLGKSILEAAECQRAERAEIDPKLGYFKEGNNFVEGSLLVKLRDQIWEKKMLIRTFEEEKGSKDQEKKQRAIFKCEFIQKEIQSIEKELGALEHRVNIYKDRLRFAEKEANCEYAKQKWPLIYGQYQTLELLGKGGFGEVYRCYDLETNKDVAIKVNCFSGQNSEELFKFVHREIEQSKKFNHPNIAKFIKLLECQDNRIVFALEYCSGPNLSTYLKKNICIEEKQAKQIIRQIFSALNYLSNLDEKVIHYDLKPANIMFHYGTVKIVDFGLCKPMLGEESKMNLTSQGVGTYWYLPPETYEYDDPQISPKVDVWSAGVIFYEMLYSRKPFGHGVSQEKIFNEGIILNNAKKWEFPVETPGKGKVSEGAKQFIRQCLAYNARDRLSAREAYEHEYFKK